MSEEKDSNTDFRISNADASEIERHSIFTYQEIESFVKSFILAYLRGLVHINFNPSEYAIERRQKQKRRKLTEREINKISLDYKTGLRHKIEVCSGTHKVTADESKRTVYGLFSDIIAFTNGKRIEGEFLPIELEQKISEMEKKYDATDKLVSKIYSVLIDEAISNDTTKM